MYPSSPKFDVGDLIKFKMLSDFTRGEDVRTATWIDGNGAEIVEGSVGVIIRRTPGCEAEIDWGVFLGWNYDVYIPSLGISSTWGEVALEPMQ